MDQTDQQVSQEPNKRDVSRQTLIVLVVLAVVVSLLGTFTVLRETTGINKIVYRNEMSAPAQSATGVVTLKIINPQDAPENSATGQVIFEVVAPINQ
jgi:hypothetical protein